MSDGQPTYPPQAPMNAPPPKKKHTVRNVILIVVALMILGIGGCMALVGTAADSIDKAIKKDENKPGGTHNPMEIVEGQPFSVDHFDYAGGWKLKRDMIGDAEIVGLKVTNNRDDKDLAWVEVKLWKGSEVLALINCNTNDIDVGTTVKVDCSSTDKLPKSYDKMTINDSF